MNPGAPLAPLDRAASGGELSRLLLALKTVLSRVATVPTLVFDEVDSASAVPSPMPSVPVWRGWAAIFRCWSSPISPQVAARGDQHWRVAKRGLGGAMVTRVEVLDPALRQEEIARMLSGAVVTAEARAAASRMLRDAGEVPGRLSLPA